MDHLPATLETLFQKNIMPSLSEPDIELAVTALAIADQKRRFYIGKLLENQGEDALDALADGLANGEPEVRRSAVFILGRLLEGPHASLTRALQDADAKVRKNACIALGRFKDASIAPVLLTALQQETQEWVSPSLILAIGATQPQLLKDYKSQNPEETEALRKALDQGATLPSSPVFRDALPLYLSTLPGLEDAVVSQNLPLKPIPVAIQSSGRYSITTKPETLWQFRAMTEFLLPLSTFDWNIETTLPLPPLEALDTYHAKNTDIPFRLELRHIPLQRHAQRRDRIPDLVSRMAERYPRWRNSPSRYIWELRLEPVGGRRTQEAAPPTRWQWLAKPCALPDPRFFYRAKDIPASMSGPTAGGIMTLAKPYLTQNARVIDPCCGSGTLLFERHVAGTCTTTGVDIAHSAIEAAKANDAVYQQQHKAHTQWIGKDILRYTPDEPFDELFSNLPFGLRVGGHDDNVALYEGLFAKLPQLLKPEGLLVLYSQEVQLLDKLSRQAPVSVLVRKRIEVGGLKPLLLILRWKG